MAYQDYEWEMRDAPVLWRVAELYARVLIGGGWAIATLVVVTMLVERTGVTWGLVAYVGLLHYGIQLATPRRRCDAD